MTQNTDKTPPATLTIDWDKYLSQLEDWDVAEDRKREFIAALWGLLVSCAEIGLGLHPAQKRQEKMCGKDEEKLSKSARDKTFVLVSKDQINSNKKKKSTASTGPEKESL